jgi:hypothetical protein
MREADIERKHRTIALLAGWFVEKLQSVGRNGFPDRFYAHGGSAHRCSHCGRGRIVLIEWKRPGEHPNPQQLLRHKQLRAAGVEVHVIDNIADANRVLELHDTHGRGANTGSVEMAVSRRDRL